MTTTTATESKSLSTLTYEALVSILALLSVATVWAAFCLAFGMAGASLLHFDFDWVNRVAGFTAGCGFWYVVTNGWHTTGAAPWKLLRARLAG